MRKRLLLFIAVGLAAVALSAVYIVSHREKPLSHSEQVKAEIYNSPCAKFETPDSQLYVTGEILTLKGYFSSVMLIESNEEVTDWRYRITFNCNEIAVNAREIVVLVGDNAMSIDGVSYTTPGYSDLVETVRSKYDYLSK